MSDEKGGIRLTNKSQSKLSKTLYNILQKLHNQRHLYSIRISFLSIMPLMLAGAYAVVINNFPISGYQEYMESAFGPGWKDFGGLIFNSTIQITTLILILSLGVNLSRWYKDNQKINVHPIICGMVSLASYMIMNLDISGSTISFFDTGVTGIFGAIIIGIISCEAFIHIYNLKIFSFYVNYDPDIEVPTSFISIIPFIIVVFGFAIVRQVIIASGIGAGMNDIINQALSRPYEFNQPSISSTIIYNLSTHLMWIFGIHGNNVLDMVAKGFFEQVQIGQGLIISKTLLDAFVY